MRNDVEPLQIYSMKMRGAVTASNMIDSQFTGQPPKQFTRGIPDQDQGHGRPSHANTTVLLWWPGETRAAACNTETGLY